MKNKSKLKWIIGALVLTAIIAWMTFYKMDPLGFFNHVGSPPMGEAT